MGNDIVDTDAPGAKNRAVDSRFMNKIFSDEEKAAIRGAEDPDAMLWGLWAAKESAYKAIFKGHPEVSSSPLKYPVTVESKHDPKAGNLLSVTVATPRGPVAASIYFYENRVCCIGITGNPPDLEKIIWGCADISSLPEIKGLSTASRESQVAKKLALQRIAACCGRNRQDLEIRNDGGRWGSGPPVLYHKGEKDKIDISLSHDYRYVAYAFIIMPE